MDNSSITLVETVLPTSDVNNQQERAVWFVYILNHITLQHVSAKMKKCKVIEMSISVHRKRVSC